MGKALEYRKQYRSWRTKQNHGSHGEFNRVVDLTPAKMPPLQLPSRAERHEFDQIGSPQPLCKAAKGRRMMEDVQVKQHELQADLARKRKSESGETDEDCKRLKKADESVTAMALAEDDPMRVFDFLLGACC